MNHYFISNVYFQSFHQSVSGMQGRNEQKIQGPKMPWQNRGSCNYFHILNFYFTGTTWTQEMAWCIANDLDFEKAKVFLPLRFPFLELVFDTLLSLLFFKEFSNFFFNH